MFKEMTSATFLLRARIVCVVKQIFFQIALPEIRRRCTSGFYPEHHHLQS